MNDSIRPSLWAFALLVLAGIGSSLWLVLGSDLVTERGASSDDTELAWRTGDLDAGVPWQSATGGVSSATGPMHGDPANYAAANETVEDPQMFAMRRSYGTQDAGTGAPFGPTTIRGRLTTANGIGPSHGAMCSVRVLPVRARQFNCLVRVMCDGVVLYPDEGQSAGYAPCEIEDGVPTRAVDTSHTDSDGDPAVDVDFFARRVRISDTGSFAEVELDAVRL